jgi:hypothetical protein
MIVVVSDAHILPVQTTLSTIQALLFARLLAESIASKGRPNLSQMINLLPTEVQLNLTDFGGERCHCGEE